MLAGTLAVPVGLRPFYPRVWSASTGEGWRFKVECSRGFGLIASAILAITVGCSAAKKDNGQDPQSSASTGAGDGSNANTNGGGAGDDTASSGGSGSTSKPSANGSGGTKAGGGAGKKGSGAGGTDGASAASGGGDTAGSNAMNPAEMLDPDVDWTGLTLVFPA